MPTPTLSVKPKCQIVRKDLCFRHVKLLSVLKSYKGSYPEQADEIAMKLKDEDSIEVKSLGELRAWLGKNHSKSKSVWLITYKKTVHSNYIPYTEIVDELLCFGWIDSLPRALDEKRKMLRISPRRSGSAWSKINRDKVKRLISAGRMTEAGMRVLRAAKRDGSWDRLKQTDNNAIPTDLAKAFARYPGSKENFQKFPPSSIRAILEWIALAKKDLTREKRLNETAKLAAKNLRANFPLRVQERIPVKKN